MKVPNLWIIPHIVIQIMYTLIRLKSFLGKNMWVYFDKNVITYLGKISTPKEEGTSYVLHAHFSSQLMHALVTHLLLVRDI